LFKEFWLETNLRKDVDAQKAILRNETINDAIRWASKNVHHDLVQLLLKDSRVDPSADGNYSIRRASAVRMLIPE
jgi:hypothetical protein